MRRSISVCAVIFLVAGCCAAQGPLGTGIGARPLSMGNAFVGLANDGSAIFLNPAGLTNLDPPVLTSMYTQPTGSSTFTLLGGTIPNRFGATLGLGYRNLVTTNVIVSSSETDSYLVQEISLPFAKQVSDNLALGGALRFLSQGYSRNIAGLEGLYGSGYSLDASLKYSQNSWFSVGIALQSLTGQINYRDNTSAALPMDTIVGTSVKLGGAGGYLKNLKQSLYVNADFSRSAQDPLLTHVGVEFWPLDLFAIRLGLDQTAKSPTETFSHYTGGVGIKYRGITFDYAIYKQGDSLGNTSSYFSLGFAGPEKTPLIAFVTPESFPSPAPEPSTARKVKRVVFSDLPANHWAKGPAELLATAGLLPYPPDGLFHPNVKLTRMQFSLLYLSAKNLSSSDPAKDVGGVQWSENPDKFVTRLEAAKVLGLTEKVARPADPLTRAEYASFLSKSPIGQAAIKRLSPLDK